jgi:disulfide bond formation protein DsbB
MALFPLAVLLGVAAYRSDTSITPYALPFTAVGAFVALYQVAGPYWFGGEHICIFKEDCASDVISFFGVINFPMLSALGFILVFLLLWRGSSRNTFTAS